MLQHFNLTSYPFRKDIPIENLTLSRSQKDAAEALQQVIRTKEIGILVGEPGMGKPLTLAYLSKKLPRGNFKLISLPNPQGSARYIWRHLVRQLGIDTPGPDAFRGLLKQLIFFAEEIGRQPLLLVDEAHQLRPETIEELRLLTNITLDNTCPCILIMAGQPELLSRLHNPAFEAFNQRVGVRFRLMPMGEEETYQYIDSHLRLAGATRQIFDDEAKQLIFSFTKGIPRKVNRSCLDALNYAYQRGLHQIDADTIKEATEESMDV